MSTVGFVTDPVCLDHEHPGHPERPQRLLAILRQLDEAGLRTRMVELVGRDATEAEVLSVHEPEVLAMQSELQSQGGGWVDADTYVRGDSPGIALRSAGATLVAVEAVLRGGVDRSFAAVRPPGHHATADTMMGFCLLNNVAIAVATARTLGATHIAVIDWDVHHGNGTQAIFDGDPDLLYVSTHASPYYPGTGAVAESGVGAARGTKVNVPLPLGTGDSGYAAAYDQVVLPALERFKPELILVSCGWDAHIRDQIGPMQLSTAGYTGIAQRIVLAADQLCDGKLVATLEGGYDEHALAWCASAFCEVLLGEEPTPDPEPLKPSPEPEVGMVLAEARAEAGLS